MRLLPRHAVVDEVNGGTGEGNHGRSMEVPLKAQKILGQTGRVKNGRSLDIKHSDPDSFWDVRDAEQKSLGVLRESDVDSDTVPGARRGAPLPSAPVLIRSSDELVSNDSTTLSKTSSAYPGHQPSYESMNREYYEASKQPLNVSQQTSESSVRDIAGSSQRRIGVHTS